MPEIIEELKLTYTDILSLGESNQRMELLDGEFIMSAMPSSKHQRIATTIGFMLEAYSQSRNTGIVLSSPIDVVISESIVLQPDVSYLSFERSNIDDGKKYTASPDLVVEILSESTEERDRTFKFREYARGGAKEYWLVSPEKKEIEVYENSGRGFQLQKIFNQSDIMSTPLFPDAQFMVKDIFP